MDILNENPYFRDVFLSHASLDKERFIEPFIDACAAHNAANPVGESPTLGIVCTPR
jgi:hypothetical protein